MYLFRNTGCRRQPLDVILRPGEPRRQSQEETRDLVDLGHVQVELDALVGLWGGGLVGWGISRLIIEDIFDFCTQGCENPTWDHATQSKTISRASTVL